MTSPRSLMGTPSRRQFLIATAASVGAITLGACSDDDTPTSASSSGSSSPRPGTATITNKYGTYAVPLNPERLVLMENRVELEIATALGLAPIAVGHFFEFEGGPARWVAPWVPFEPRGDEEIFRSFETSTEYLLTLDPDLIVSGSNWLDAGDPPYWAYDALAEVAPVLPVGLESDWRADLRQIAEWMGRAERLEATLADFAELRDSIKDKHGDKLSTAQMAMGSAEPPALGLADFDSGSPAARALQELGGTLMPFSDPSAVDGGWLDLSPERIGELNEADGVLLWGPDTQAVNELTSNPLWAGIPAVEAGTVVISSQNVGSGHVYTVMECMRLWDEVYDTLD